MLRPLCCHSLRFLWPSPTSSGELGHVGSSGLPPRCLANWAMWAWTCRTCCHRWFGFSTPGCPGCASGPSPMGRGFPVGSASFSASISWLWPVSDGLPSGPHGQWLARGSFSSPSLLCQRVPWVPVVSGSSWLLPQSGGVSSIRLASLCCSAFCSTFSPRLVGLVLSSGASFGCVVAPPCCFCLFAQILLRIPRAFRSIFSTLLGNFMTKTLFSLLSRGQVVVHDAHEPVRLSPKLASLVKALSKLLVLLSFSVSKCLPRGFVHVISPRLALDAPGNPLVYWRVLHM